MDVERQLRPAKPPSKRAAIDLRYYGVRTLYLEDLIAILRAVEMAQEPAREEQRREQADWREHMKLLRREYMHNAKAFNEPPMPDYFQRPIIEMSNEQYEFDTLDQVAALPRKHFRELNISGRHGWFRFHIDPAWCYIMSQAEDVPTREAIGEIDRVVRRRQVRLVAWLCRRDVISVWFVLVAVTYTASRSTASLAVDATAALILWLGIFAGAWYFLAWSNRKRVVVPTFLQDAGTLWDWWAGLVTIVLSILSVIIALLTWWFPRK